MQFMHSEVTLNNGQSVIVALDHAANVKVMDGANFGRYQRGESHKYFGGHATESPVVICPPHPVDGM